MSGMTDDFKGIFSFDNDKEVVEANDRMPMEEAERQCKEHDELFFDSDARGEGY